jgi:hypothetical protein
MNSIVIDEVEQIKKLKPELKDATNTEIIDIAMLCTTEMTGIISVRTILEHYIKTLSPEEPQLK